MELNINFTIFWLGRWPMLAVILAWLLEPSLDGRTGRMAISRVATALIDGLRCALWYCCNRFRIGNCRGKPLQAKSADGTKLKKTSGRGVLQYASYVGATAKNSETCTKLYPHCPFDSDTILIVFRAVGSSPLIKAFTHPTPSHKLTPPKIQPV